MIHFQKKLFSGLFVIILLSLIFALFLKIFIVRAQDVTRIKDLMTEDELRKVSGENEEIAPTVTRWNFSFKLPVPGEKDKNHWKIEGGLSRSIDANRDRITPFRGDFSEGGEPVSLSASEMVFDKEKRLLTTDEDVEIDLTWSRHNGRGFYFDMETQICKTFENSVTRIDKSGAKKSSIMSGEDAPDTSAKERSTSTLKTKGGVLTINANEFSYYMAEGRMVYNGNVFAWDTSGVIKSDRMEVFNYSDEEMEADPSLSGVKQIVCTGNVKIDQLTKWAVADKALFDVAEDIMKLTSVPPRRARFWELAEDRKDIKITSAKTLINNRRLGEFKGSGGASQIFGRASEVDKVKILGFDSIKLGLIIPKAEAVDENDTQTRKLF
jgi:LptA/(LptD N-terminal domain) LPS transport protein